jgi:hypothetical protein
LFIAAMLNARKRALLSGGKAGKKQKEKEAVFEDEVIDVDEEFEDQIASEDVRGDDFEESAADKRLRIGCSLVVSNILIRKVCIYHLRLECELTSSQRAAKEYISKLKAAAAAAGESDDDDKVAGKLAADAAAASGRLQRKIAHRVALAPITAASAAYGDGKILRGIRLSATAVALSHDDRAVYCVSKCGAVNCFDLEAGTRCAATVPASPSRIVRLQIELSVN